MEDNLSLNSSTSSNLILVRVGVPELNVEKCLQFHKDEIICTNDLPLLKTPSFGISDTSFGNTSSNPFAIKSGPENNRAEVSTSAPCNAYEPAFINSSRVFSSL